MTERIVVTIAADGSIAAETIGITGKACLDYLPMLEDLLDAETVTSEFTADYQVSEQTMTTQATQTAREHQ